MVDYLCYVKKKLDNMFKDSKLTQLSLSGEISVSVIGMPERFVL